MGQHTVFVTQVAVHGGETIPRIVFYVVELTPKNSDLGLSHENSQRFSCPALTQKFQLCCRGWSSWCSCICHVLFCSRQLNSDRSGCLSLLARFNSPFSVCSFLFVGRCQDLHGVCLCTWARLIGFSPQEFSKNLLVPAFPIHIHLCGKM